jgi:hypothetical protein
MSYQAPPPGGGYGQQPGYGAPMPDNSSKATWALVLGILSIPCCGLFTGIPAIILGQQVMNVPGPNAGKGKAGFICGIIGTALSILGIIANIAIRSSS